MPFDCIVIIVSSGFLALAFLFCARSSHSTPWASPPLASLLALSSSFIQQSAEDGETPPAVAAEAASEEAVVAAEPTTDEGAAVAEAAAAAAVDEPAVKAEEDDAAAAAAAAIAAHAAAPSYNPEAAAAHHAAATAAAAAYGAGYPYYPPPPGAPGAPHHFWGAPGGPPHYPPGAGGAGVDGREGATSPSQIETSHRDEVQHMGCTCKKTRCLKLYCQCFGAKIYCGSNCRCLQCHNTPKNEKARKDAIRIIVARNPSAFDTKFKKAITGAVMPGSPEAAVASPEAKTLSHKVGCKCRRSNCMKKVRFHLY
jgi:Tesmin/TSO1-like CXC domain, cysteine-rich domain